MPPYALSPFTLPTWGMESQVGNIPMSSLSVPDTSVSFSNFSLGNPKTISNSQLNNGTTGGFNWNSFKDWGTGLSALGSVYDAYNKNQYNNLMKDQLNFNKDVFNKNFAFQQQAVNAGVDARNYANTSARPLGYAGGNYKSLETYKV